MFKPQNLPRIVCLLPVRNASYLLPAYFDSVRPFCHSIAALDDGSTDDTATILAAEPLVKLVLSNQQRPSYYGWDDSANRQQLLNACETLAPDWVLWLDADEFVPSCDVHLLKKFISTQAHASEAYGFEVLRMVGDRHHFDKNKLWVYRLFAYRPGFLLPSEKLHFEPVPTQIPRELWRRTRLRIAHLAGLTAPLRRARYQKYLEADPQYKWQDSYAEILDPPGHIWELKPIQKGIDILLD